MVYYMRWAYIIVNICYFNKQINLITYLKYIIILVNNKNILLNKFKPFYFPHKSDVKSTLALFFTVSLCINYE